MSQLLIVANNNCEGDWVCVYIHIYIVLLKIMPIFALIKRSFNFSKIRTFCLSSGLGNKNNSWPILRRRYGIVMGSKTKDSKNSN